MRTFSLDLSRVLSINENPDATHALPSRPLRIHDSIHKDPANVATCMQVTRSPANVNGSNIKESNVFHCHLSLELSLLPLLF